MRKHHPENVAVRREYLRWLANAQGKDEATCDQVASAIERFEAHTGWKDFRTFRRDQAISFKVALANEINASGKPLSKATRCGIFRHLKAFFEWLSREQGYRRAVAFSDAAYFNPNGNEARAAGATRQRPYPSLEQVHAALEAMPIETPMQRRDRAVVALILLTAGRDGAVASLRLKHIDIAAKTVFFDARDVNTKRAKTFKTAFYPVGRDAEAIIVEWERELRELHLFGPDDPLFPRTRIAPNTDGAFEACGLERRPWSDAGPIRSAFKAAFGRIGLPAYNPHSIRQTITQLAYSLKLGPMEMQAWAQNMGHEHLATTFSSYGKLRETEQIAVISALEAGKRAAGHDGRFSAEDVSVLMNKLKADGRL